MGRPRRVSEPHSGGGWTTRVADAPPPEVRVGRACVPVDHENLDRFRLVGTDRRGPAPRGEVGAAFRGGDRRPGRGPAGRDPSRPAGGGRRGQPAAAGGVPVERRLGGGPDEAGGPSLPRRRPGGPPGRRVAAPLRPHGADVGRLRGSAGARAGPSARPVAVARRPDGEAVAPCRRGGRTITPRSTRRSSSTSPWAPTRGARRSHRMHAHGC